MRKPFLARLFGWEPFTFRHREREEAVITFYARDEKSAWKKMRAFVRDKMYGPCALWYHPAAVNQAMEGIYLEAENE